MLIARSGTLADVGAYALALAITAPIQLGLGLRLRTVRAVDTSATEFRTYLHLAMAMSGIAVLIGGGIGILIAPNFRFAIIVTLVALAKAVESIIDVCYGEYQRQDRLVAIATSQLLRAGLTLGLVALGAHIGGLVSALVAMTLGWAAQLLMVDGRRLRSVPTPLADHAHARSTASALLRLSWPLGLAATVASLTVSLPRFTVAGLLDASALGVLALLTYPTTVMSLFANSVGQATVKAMSNNVQAGNFRAMWAALRGALLATGCLGLLGFGLIVAAGRRGIDWLLGEAYAKDLPLLLLLVLAATFAGFATNAYYLLVSTGHFSLQPVVICASLGLALPLVYVGTRAYGLVGTAVALVVMYALQAGLSLILALVVLRRRSTAVVRRCAT